ncbi:MAG TPA: hypothetical protein VFH54_09665, partial [Mycobacteriales bacterium]|nr:hypothetical protein [Mycobacteriales bacterium]
MSNKSRVRTWIGWIWALLPLLLALPAPFCFWWAAHRLRSRALVLEAWAYLVVCGVWITLAGQHSSAVSDAGATLAVAAAVVAFVRALMLRRRLFEPVPVHPDFVPVPAAPVQQPVAWTPSFPGQHPVPRDPNNPATWVTSVACTGSDRHRLSLSWKHAIGPAVGGALAIAFDVRLHVYGRGLGLGIGLLLTPVFALLFARWVDGPVLYYRNWGRLHRLSLDKVTVVGARSVSLLLSAPGSEEPVRLAVAARGFSLSPAARDHLRGWLGSPSVQWAPRARALLDGAFSAQPLRPRRAQRALAILLGLVLPLAAVGTGAWLIYHRNREAAIPGASGYRRFGGPHGKWLAVGRPWGHACQPVRLTVEEHVPDWVYQQVSLVTNEAHADGINITLETRNFA